VVAIFRQHYISKKKYNPTLYDGAPPGTFALYNETGYMTDELLQMDETFHRSC
jgi:hypothetical protein